jgi:hypothetical protein
MKIGILGTGRVAQSLAGAFATAGHAVTLGARAPETKTGMTYAVAGHAATVRDADLVVNATPGDSSVEVITRIGDAAFAGKVLLDVANAVTPSFELIYPNTSLAEALQAALPSAMVVKALNTLNTSVMANPTAIGPSTVFLSGDAADAKAAVARLLGDLGWGADAILDLGGIASARGPEHYFPLFAAVLRALGTPTFNIRVIR